MKVLLICLLSLGLCFAASAGRKYSGKKTAPKSQTKQSGPELKRSSVQNHDDPLDKQIEFFRNRDYSVPGVMQYTVYTLKVQKVLGSDAGIFIVQAREFMNQWYMRGGTTDNEGTIAWIYIDGIKMANRAQGDFIKLKDGETLWRIGAKKVGGETLKRYTMDRAAAEKFIKENGPQK